MKKIFKFITANVHEKGCKNLWKCPLNCCKVLEDLDVKDGMMYSMGMLFEESCSNLPLSCAAVYMLNFISINHKIDIPVEVWDELTLELLKCSDLLKEKLNSLDTSFKFELEHILAILKKNAFKDVFDKLDSVINFVEYCKERELYTLYLSPMYSDEDRRFKFTKLKFDEWIFRAGFNWSGITDELRRKMFGKLKYDWWIYRAMSDWSGITDDMRIRAFNKLKSEEWICYAGILLNTILPNEIKIKAFKRLKNEKWIFEAGKMWFGIPMDLVRRRFEKFKQIKWKAEAYKFLNPSEC